MSSCLRVVALANRTQIEAHNWRRTACRWCPLKGLNTKAVFERPKEQLNLSTLPIGPGDRRSRGI